MTDADQLARQHETLTRRYFLQLGAAGAAAVTASPLWAGPDEAAKAIERAVAKWPYLTPLSDFRMVGRGKPAPHTLPAEKLREVGLAPETWRLEVVPDPDSNAKVDNPLTKQAGNALDWKGLMALAEKHAVSYLQVMSCTNVADPMGMGLWEGVPLRTVIWLARPSGNVRRVFYYGYHNDDPKQRFQASLPIGRVLEDPPGEHPVILCYKLNGQRLSPKAGGPVRMIVPNTYGNKSVKWLQRVVLTNEHRANDTYAGWNNDTDSAVKTCARFVRVPKTAPAGGAVAVTGLAQVGISGLSKVQVWLHPAAEPLDKLDPYFTKAAWQDAEVLGPPDDWGGGLPGGKLPAVPREFDPKTARPRSWPLHNTIVHWAVLLTDLRLGRYDLRCRTIDAAGHAQPMPRPFPKSGRNDIQRVPLLVDV
ncbi:MAG TPA: molybdopterin-dependent oxidoreductase [Phycisphaerae bacterium]|nr:molybdopterin-dependent oxidoreductase [Phycisphaerae bacterium]